ncbi:hypothetical protein [Vibrio owensii]|uniref:hypothetical protein n=1 Tax=Vibrio owensii TaxID=696485 RepID=UPI0018F238AE|nr:hypothetical protein [Vibrio owensii]
MKKIIGYQVQNKQQNHWKNRPSYEVLTQLTALQEFQQACIEDPEGNYSLLSIMEGDIEDPTFENQTKSAEEQLRDALIEADSFSISGTNGTLTIACRDVDAMHLQLHSTDDPEQPCILTEDENGTKAKFTFNELYEAALANKIIMNIHIECKLTIDTSCVTPPPSTISLSDLVSQLTSIWALNCAKDESGRPYIERRDAAPLIKPLFKLNPKMKPKPPAILHALHGSLRECSIQQNHYATTISEALQDANAESSRIGELTLNALIHAEDYRLPVENHQLFTKEIAIAIGKEFEDEAFIDKVIFQMHKHKRTPLQTALELP